MSKTGKRPSPASVACIDLTLDSDSDADDKPVTSWRQTKLGEVRKKLNPLSLAPSKKLSKKRSRSGSHTTSVGAISVLDSDEDSEANSSDKKPKARVKAKLSLSTVASPAFVEDGLEIVEPTAAPLVPVASTVTPDHSSSEKNKNKTDDADEIEVVGAKNHYRLPHMRQHCTEFPFDKTLYGFGANYAQKTLEQNAKSCDMCYCYVCDCPVKECKSWSSFADKGRRVNHCCATDDSAYWKTQRDSKKGIGGSASASRVNNGLNRDYLLGMDEDEDAYAYHHFASDLPLLDWMSGNFNSGLFPPDSTSAKNNKALTKCRKCGWYSSLSGSRDATTKDDYCLKCGRVASVKDFGKVQGKTLVPTGNHVWFGTCKIPFRLSPRNPTEMWKYSDSWKEHQGSSGGWQYNEIESQYDTFRHQISARPKPTHIVTLLRLSARSNGDDEILVETERDWQLLKFLGKSDLESNVQIDAKWDRENSKGEFTVQLYLHRNEFQSKRPGEKSQWSFFLGLWFNIFPVAGVAELVGAREATDSDALLEDYDSEDYDSCYSESEIGWVERQRDSLSEADFDKLKNEVQTTLAAYDADHKTIQKRLKLEPSSSRHRDDPHVGQLCRSTKEVGLDSLLRAYYADELRTIRSCSIGKRRSSWLREAFLGCSHQSYFPTNILSELEAILGPKNTAFYDLFLYPQRRELKYFAEPNSIQTAMLCLENLGHEEVDFVEGLNIELLDFQKQTLQWALERETMEGGIQRFLWAKLPKQAEKPPVLKRPAVVQTSKELYYNPIISKFRKTPPRLVRGGFIAEEMGLGKTVITLALILKNPAPILPASGSSVQSLSNLPTVAAWDKTLHLDTPSDASKLRGSILSRGTLVICPVSLVGQWIDEAKSKLNDPGVVYPYHGANRKRDANILSQHSIVVTTYQVLASDATYHAKKAKAGSDYCPPLEQIRWWRIVCDEGHSLRERQTLRSKATLALQADHKWLVSGTPLNTSFKDLTNQLKFLGVEDSEDMIRIVTGGGGARAIPRMNDLQFLLGNIMMRHSQKQKYAGTNTTLMSLPKKTERTIHIKFSPAEQREYAAIEKEARDYYLDFRAEHASSISKFFLKLSTKLLPIRVACAGGNYPLPHKDIDNDMLNETKASDNDLDVDKAGVNEPNNGRRKTSTKFSKFAFKSKCKALIKELSKIRDSDSTCKSLVFSQFSSTLKWLQEELPRHGFQYRTLSGSMSMTQRAKALKDFQSDPPTTIFLLSMRSGAVGINLTQANRVFLMEPCFNPALEQQAIGRVHRLGQKREVEIIRLIQKDSVESRLVEYLEKKYGSSSSLATTGKDQVCKSKKANNGTELNNAGRSGEKTISNETVLVGNVARDKASMMLSDFDLLFGAAPMKSEDNETSVNSMDIDNCSV